MSVINLSKYNIIIEENSLLNLNFYISPFLNKNAKTIFIITDSNLYNLYSQKLTKLFTNLAVEYIILKPGESTKSLRVYEETINKLLDLKIKKDSLLLAFGGGVIGDLTGFIAATLFRGINYIQIPTSLLAQVDSSIGGKVGINTASGKNQLGAFYDPVLVIIDPVLLQTLSKREYRNGLVEVLKSALIGDRRLYKLLQNKNFNNLEIIERAVLVKKSIISKDPYDKKERLFLNYGHSFGHAIEHFYQYKRFKHGEAVAVGIIGALKLGIKLSISTKELLDDISATFKNLEIDIPDINYNLYLDILKHDKKTSDKSIKFIFLKDIGFPFLNNIDFAFLKDL